MLNPYLICRQCDQSFTDIASAVGHAGTCGSDQGFDVRSGEQCLHLEVTTFADGYHDGHLSRVMECVKCHESKVISPRSRWSLTKLANAIKVAAELRWEAQGLDAGFDGGEWSGPDHWKSGVEDAAAILRWAGWTANEFADELERRTSEKWAAIYFPMEFVAEVAMAEEGPEEVY